MSFIVTPPSARAPMAASAARSTMSLSGCLPNFVMWMPRIQMSSLAHAWCSVLDDARAVAWPVRSRSRWLRCRCRPSPSEYVARRTFMPSVTCSGSGSTLMMLPRTLVPSQSTTADTNGTGMPGAANGDDRERAHVAVGRHVDLRELGAEARRRRRCGGRRTCAPQLVHWCRHEVRAVAEHQVVDERDLFAHRAAAYVGRRPLLASGAARVRGAGRPAARTRRHGALGWGRAYSPLAWRRTSSCTTSGSGGRTCRRGRRSPCSAAIRGGPS